MDRFIVEDKIADLVEKKPAKKKKKKRKKKKGSGRVGAGNRKKKV
jgi:hypothetical protein